MAHPCQMAAPYPYPGPILAPYRSFYSRQAAPPKPPPNRRILGRRAKSALQIRPPKLKPHPVVHGNGPTSISVGDVDALGLGLGLGMAAAGSVDQSDGLSTGSNDSVGTRRSKPATARISIFFGKVTTLQLRLSSRHSRL